MATRQPDIADWGVFHRNNDADWARRATASTGWDPTDHSKISLSASDVRNIRLLAGISDDEPADSILNLDGRGMKPGQYLLLTEKSGGCVKAAAYERDIRQVKELWSSDGSMGASEMCQQPGCPAPRVLIGEKRTISILTYFRSATGSPVCDQSKTTTYEPGGSGFERRSQHTDTSRCRVGSSAGLSAALWQAAGPSETLAIIQFLPTVAAHPERYALALQRNAEGARVIRMDWPEIGSPDIGDLSKATAFECYSRLSSLPVKTMELKVPQERATELAAALSRIDVRADRCSRNAVGQCAMFHDGTTFHVEVRDHAPVNVFDLRNEKSYVSENPQLARWIYQLLDASPPATGIAPN